MVAPKGSGVFSSFGGACCVGLSIANCSGFSAVAEPIVLHLCSPADPVESRPMRTRIAWILLVTLLWTCSAAARDIFVSNSQGDDGATGREPIVVPNRSGPVRTIAKALRLAEPGDRIVLEKTAEPYRETLSLVGSRHSGRVGADFVVEGNGAVLDGSVPVPSDAWENYHGPVFRFAPPRLGLLQLFRDGKPLVRVYASRWSDSPPELQPLQWCLHGGWVYFCVERMKLPDNYTLSYTLLRTGITLYHVENVRIQDLTVQGFQVDGVSAFNSARNVRLLRLTCRGNGRSGVSVGGASIVNLEDSLVGNNGEAQLLTLPLSETYLRDAQLLSNTAPGWVDQGGKVLREGKPIAGGLDERTGTAPQAP